MDVHSTKGKSVGSLRRNKSHGDGLSLLDVDHLIREEARLRVKKFVGTREGLAADKKLGSQEQHGGIEACPHWLFARNILYVWELFRSPVIPSRLIRCHERISGDRDGDRPAQ